jgi:cbb3-type cytochrome oxidase subunit 3
VLLTDFAWGKTGMLGLPAGLWDVVLIILVVCALIYFYFSKEHKGWFGGVAKVGIYTLMIGFGASFGLTVMARLSLFIDRVQFVNNWVSLVISKL